MKKNFGFTTADYNILLSASTRRGFHPSAPKVNHLINAYPKLKREQAITALMLLNSPARDTFTAYDLFSHLDKYYK